MFVGANLRWNRVLHELRLLGGLQELPYSLCDTLGVREL
jgi:hypothetical protein